ncbi:hypothetical protein R5R35_010312 [Gryllus longicercus]|uniref:Uncharacterized protein n=1 Tax=Gryllus longicercus TaxID=2509291 RepID=A0AAN9V6E4_9ORTH
MLLEPSNVIDNERESDVEVIFSAKPPSKQKCKEIQTGPVPQFQTKVIWRKKIKLLQMRLYRRNKKISNIAELIKELIKDI